MNPIDVLHDELKKKVMDQSKIDVLESSICLDIEESIKVPHFYDLDIESILRIAKGSSFNDKETVKLFIRNMFNYLPEKAPLVLLAINFECSFADGMEILYEFKGCPIIHSIKESISKVGENSPKSGKAQNAEIAFLKNENKQLKDMIEDLTHRRTLPEIDEKFDYNEKIKKLEALINLSEENQSESSKKQLMNDIKNLIKEIECDIEFENGRIERIAKNCGINPLLIGFKSEERLFNE